MTLLCLEGGKFGPDGTNHVFTPSQWRKLTRAAVAPSSRLKRVGRGVRGKDECEVVVCADLEKHLEMALIMVICTSEQDGTCLRHWTSGVGWDALSLLYSRMDVLLKLICGAYPSCRPARLVRYKMGPYMHWDIWCRNNKQKKRWGRRHDWEADERDRKNTSPERQTR